MTPYPRSDISYEQSILDIMSRLKQSEKEVKEKSKTRGKRTHNKNSSEKSRKRSRPEPKKEITQENNHLDKRLVGMLKSTFDKKTKATCFQTTKKLWP